MKKLSHMIPSALQGFFAKPAPQAPADFYYKK